MASDQRVRRAIISVAVLLNSLVGTAGLVLWIKLYLTLPSATAAGTCVVRIFAALVLSVSTALIGGYYLKRPPHLAVFIGYLIGGTLMLFFAIYCTLFLWWAIRVWPDQCICNC